MWLDLSLTSSYSSVAFFVFRIEYILVCYVASCGLLAIPLHFIFIFLVFSGTLDSLTSRCLRLGKATLVLGSHSQHHGSE